VKKLIVLILAAVIIGSFMLAFAQEKTEEKAKVDPKVELAKSVERGYALFNDKKLGTSGKACSDCHMGGGTQEGKLGDVTVRAFDNLQDKYPMYWPMAKKVMTLDQVVNYCVTGPLAAKPLAWDDQRMTDLVAYCASVKPAKTEAKTKQ
jgi:cytochrome c